VVCRKTHNSEGRAIGSELPFGGRTGTGKTEASRNFGKKALQTFLFLKSGLSVPRAGGGSELLTDTRGVGQGENATEQELTRWVTGADSIASGETGKEGAKGGGA